MFRNELEELHFITAIDNVLSILEHGILCYQQAINVQHTSIAMNVVQQRRDDKIIPNAGSLHSFANLYFHARNPMMYVRKALHEDICVLRM